MEEVTIYDRTNKVYSEVEVPQRYLENSELYHSMVDEGHNFYVQPLIDLDLAIQYFNDILPLYYNNEEFDYELKDGLQYLQFSQQLLDDYIEGKIAKELSLYLQSDKIVNSIVHDEKAREEIRELIHLAPPETSDAIIQKMDFKYGRSLYENIDKYIRIQILNYNIKILRSNHPMPSSKFKDNPKHINKPWDW